jgi:hypothetical protein
MAIAVLDHTSHAQEGSRTWRPQESYTQAWFASPVLFPVEQSPASDDVVEYVDARTIRRPPDAGAVLRL